MKKAVRLFAALVLLSTFALADDRDTGVLMQADRDFAKAAAAKRLEGWMAFMAPNAVLLRAEPLVGLEQIEAGMAKDFDSPSFQLTWEPTKAEAVGSGPVGCTIGRYEAKFTGDDGKPQTSQGSYMTTWHREKDGSWKVVADIGSPDPQ
jgi:ketosteroid isomerase-like protein